MPLVRENPNAVAVCVAEAEVVVVSQSSISSITSTDFEARGHQYTSEKTGGSWPPSSKSGIDSRIAISPKDSRALRPVSTRDGRKLREECTYIPNDAENDERKARSLRHVVRAWRHWYEENRDTWVVLEEEVTRERIAVPAYNRFDPEYNDREYARLKDLERGIKDEYGKRLHTTMLTLTGSNLNAFGGFRCIVDHLDDVLESWEDVYDALRYQLNDKLGVRWEYGVVIEPHKSGYGHVHVAIFTDDFVRPERFYSAIDAHVRHSPIARREAHEYEEVISVKHAGCDRDSDSIENLSAYLAEYLGLYGENPLEAPEHVQIFNAAMWASGRDRVRYSEGAQDLMRRENETERNYEFVGIAHGPDLDENEVYEADGGTRGVDWVRITGSHKVDPPPD